MQESVKKNLFSKKILYFFNILEQNEDKFIKLFWNNSDKSIVSRKKTVRYWLKNDIVKPKAFKFDTFNISKLKLENEEFAFTKESFLEDSFELFQDRVLNYMESQQCSEDSFEYKYMYYYDNFLEEINFVELNTIKKINNREYRIEILLPKEYKDREKYRYVGELKIDKNYYHIIVKNQFETISYYYMINLGLKHSNTCYGLRLGKSFDDGSPLSAKNLLTKKELSDKEKSDLYLYLNETEEIKSKEAFSPFNNSATKNFYNNFYQKVEKLNNFVNTANRILKDEIKNNTFNNIMNKEFIAFGEIAKKVQGGNSFHINNIRRTSKVFLQSLQKGEHCFIVSPLDKKLSILNEHDIKAQKSLRLNIETAKRGVHIHRIFIVKKGVTLTNYMKTNIEEMIRNGIIIKIAKYNKIASTIGLSCDFIFSKRGRVSIYQRPIDRSYIYHVSQNSTIKDDLSIDYQKIIDHSEEYYDFVERVEEINQTILEKLKGTFYHYSYGSKVDKEGNHYFWENRKIEIDSIGEVKYYNNKDIIAKGKVVIHQHQTCIGCIKYKTNNTIIFSIDNSDINFNIFKVITTAKQFMESGKDIITVGIFSRKRLDMTIAKEMIGDSKKSVLLVDSDIRNRIAQYSLNRNNKDPK